MGQKVKCERCKVNVPDFLWIENDHPVLIDKPMTIRRTDHSLDNTMKIIAEQEVQVRLCSDLFPDKAEVILDLDVNTPLEEAVFLALGAASTCWENMSGAGLFESDRCKQIGEELMDFLKQKGFLDDRRSNPETPTKLQ